MRTTFVAAGLILAIATAASAQEIGGRVRGAASGGLGVGGALGAGRGLGAGNANGVGLGTSGGLGVGAGKSTGGSGLGVQGGLGTGLNMRTRGGLLSNTDLRGRGEAGVNIDTPGAGISGSVNGSGRLRARDRRTMRPEDRRNQGAGSNRLSADDGVHAESRSLLEADLSLATRLSKIDRLRDHAMATGDFNLLTRADVLEQQARFQHAQRTQHGAASSIRQRASGVGQADVRTPDAAANAKGRFESQADFEAVPGLNTANDAITRARELGSDAAIEARARSQATMSVPRGAVYRALPEGEGAFNGDLSSDVEAAGFHHEEFNVRSRAIGRSSAEIRNNATTQQSALAGIAVGTASGVSNSVSGSGEGQTRTEGRLNAAGRQSTRFGQNLRSEFEAVGDEQLQAYPGTNVGGSATGEFDARGRSNTKLGKKGSTRTDVQGNVAAEASADSSTNNE